MPRLYPGWKRLVGNPAGRLISHWRNPVDAFSPQLLQQRHKELPWLLEQELKRLLSRLLEGDRRPDHTGSGTKQMLLSVLPCYFKEWSPAFPLQAVTACEKRQMGLGWTDIKLLLLAPFWYRLQQSSEQPRDVLLIVYWLWIINK